MMKARLDQLFALEAPDKRAADSTQLRLPTLEERVELYLRAVHGKPDVTREQYLRARDLILDAMAARFSGDTVVGPANKPLERISLADQTGLGSPAAKPPPWKLSKHRRFIGGFSVGFTAVLLLGVGIHIVTRFSIDGGQMTALAPGAPVYSQPPQSFAPSKDAFFADSVRGTRQGVGVGERTPSKLQLNDEEIVALVAAGRQLILAGDIPNARLVLQQAAEAGNATAALELGATYDPTFLVPMILRRQKAPAQREVNLLPRASTAPDAAKSRPAIADMADVRMARLWYEKARDLGSPEAATRLESLAGRQPR